jgi:hypothetical protein
MENFFVVEVKGFVAIKIVVVYTYVEDAVLFDPHWLVNLKVKTN